MKRLNNQIAFVTGGASGLGKSIAERLAAEGANVVITDVQGDLGVATASAGGFTFLQQDVSDEARWAQVIGEVEERFGRLDILVNNAGIVGSTDSFGSARLADWKKVFAVNVEGVFLGCRAAIPAMSKGGGGSIINISSIAGLKAASMAPAYGASKATVRHMTKSIAQYCAEQGLNIRCNSVHPGTIRTPLVEKSFAELARARGISLEEVFAESEAGIPTGRFTLPEDIAAAVCFLASEDARNITGAKIVVDGGSVGCSAFRRNSK